MQKINAYPVVATVNPLTRQGNKHFRESISLLGDSADGIGFMGQQVPTQCHAGIKTIRYHNVITVPEWKTQPPHNVSIRLELRNNRDLWFNRIVTAGIQLNT